MEKALGLYWNMGFLHTSPIPEAICNIMPVLAFLHVTTYSADTKQTTYSDIVLYVFLQLQVLKNPKQTHCMSKASIP